MSQDCHTSPPKPNANGGDTSSEDSDEHGVVASSEALIKPHSDGTRTRSPFASQRPPEESDMEKQESCCDQSRSTDGISNTRKYLTVAILFFINLLNYMDRFTIAGVLMDIKNFFGINNASAGLLQTVFIISYMVVAPIFGYLGDRFNRKLLIFVGMLIWSGCTLFASFITNRNHFLLFLSLRGLVGIGEASYSTIAPTLIADLFVKSKRTRMLSVFFFAIPVGSGLGYIVGSAAAKAGGSWQWALRVTPGLGLLTMMLLVVIIPNPERGASETAADRAEQQKIAQQKASYKDDLKYIVKNKTFVYVTAAFTFMAFVVGSLTIWGPVYVAYSQIIVGALAPCTGDSCEYSSVSFIFGLVTCVGGFSGVLIGAESARLWKERGRKNADPLVCGIGLLIAGPLLLAGFQLAPINLPTSWIFIFVADTAMCLTWTLVGDITMYVTNPSRRSTANAVQILIMHLFGDAGSPYLLGVMSDALRKSMPNTYYSEYLSLQRAMYVTLFCAALSGGAFLIASLYVVYDKKKVDDFLAGKQSTPPSSVSSDSAEMTHCESGAQPECKPLINSKESDDDSPPGSEVNLPDVSANSSNKHADSRGDEVISESPPYLSLKTESWPGGPGGESGLDPSPRKHLCTGAQPMLADVPESVV